jgi:hypothetical protein
MNKYIIAYETRGMKYTHDNYIEARSIIEAIGIFLSLNISTEIVSVSTDSRL